MTTKDKYKKVAYYPGCALEGTGHAYNRSTKAVGKKLGLDLVEVKDWNCCGATFPLIIDNMLWKGRIFDEADDSPVKPEVDAVALADALADLDKDAKKKLPF